MWPPISHRAGGFPCPWEPAKKTALPDPIFRGRWEEESVRDLSQVPAGGGLPFSLLLPALFLFWPGEAPELQVPAARPGAILLPSPQPRNRATPEEEGSLPRLPGASWNSIYRVRPVSLQPGQQVANKESVVRATPVCPQRPDKRVGPPGTGQSVAEGSA